MTKIKGQTALITGGASGIGYLMGKLLLEEGAKGLIIWDVNEQALARVVGEFSGQGFAVFGFRVDVGDLVQVQQTLEEMQQRALTVDILINNAGIIVGKNFSEHSQENIARTMAINALAPMQLTREVLPGMLQRGGGHIVNIASAAGMVPNPRMSVYCASKWSMIGWSDSLRIEMESGRTGVKVTTVTPYYISTGMFAGVISPYIPLLKPEYVARQVVRGIKKDKIFLRLPKSLYLLPFIKGVLPARWFDTIGGKWVGVYRTMDAFKGRGK